MKNRYHSDFIIQYKLGLLNRDVVKQIAPATKNYWRKNDYNNYFAPEVLYAQQENMDMVKTFLSRKKLLYAAKAIYHVFLAFKLIAWHAKGFKKSLANHKDLVVNTIERCKNYLGIKRALNVFGISANQFYAWKNNANCAISVWGRCYKKFPNQLTIKEVKTIKEYLVNPNFKGWSNASVYYQLIRDKAAFFSITSFYRYAHKLKLTKPRIKKPRYQKGIRAEAAKQVFHIDVTIFKLPGNVKAYIYVLMDNYSRFILNATVSLDYAAQVTFDNLKAGFEQYHINQTLPDKSLICDGGSENKGVVNDLLIENNIQKLVAQKDIVFSNSMVEAVNKRIKYDFLYWQYFPDFDALDKYLPSLVEQYNNKPHSSLFGFTPKEVFNGLIPSKNNFTALVKNEQVARINNNNHVDCTDCQ